MDANNKRRHTQLAYGHSLERHADSEQEHKRPKGATVTTKRPLIPNGRIPVKPSTELSSLTKILSKPMLDWHACEPWKKATKVFKQGSATVCSGAAYNQLHVSILQKSMDTTELRSLRGFSHKHIVDLLDIFHANGTVYYVYEYMDVSLRNIASLTARLSYHELGLACKAVSLNT